MMNVTDLRLCAIDHHDRAVLSYVFRRVCKRRGILPLAPEAEDVVGHVVLLYLNGIRDVNEMLDLLGMEKPARH
jgi:hypothetical protein